MNIEYSIIIIANWWISVIIFDLSLILSSVSLGNDRKKAVLVTEFKETTHFADLFLFS